MLPSTKVDPSLKVFHGHLNSIVCKLRIRSAARFGRGQVSAAAAEEPTVAFEKSWEGGVEVRPATVAASCGDKVHAWKHLLVHHWL